MNQLSLDCGVEAFDDRVVPAVSAATHAAHHAVIAQQLLERLAGVLTSAIGMVKNTTTRTAPTDRHSECVKYDRFLETLAQRPPYNPGHNQHVAPREV
jgi:hypothetical protein